jgi:hypothetical protein
MRTDCPNIDTEALKYDSLSSTDLESTLPFTNVASSVPRVWLAYSFWRNCLRAPSGRHILISADWKEVAQLLIDLA